MGMPPRNEDSAWPSWRFEGNKRANAQLAARNLIKVSGSYELSSADSFPPPAGSVVASCWELQTQKPRFNGYDRYCFELATSNILNVYHNSKGYKTAVLVRLVKSRDAASILLDSVLAEPGHSFTDPENGFRLEIASISSSTARIQVSI